MINITGTVSHQVQHQQRGEERNEHGNDIKEVISSLSNKRAKYNTKRHANQQGRQRKQGRKGEIGESVYVASPTNQTEILFRKSTSGLLSHHRSRLPYPPPTQRKVCLVRKTESTLILGSKCKDNAEGCPYEKSDRKWVCTRSTLNNGPPTVWPASQQWPACW